MILRDAAHSRVMTSQAKQKPILEFVRPSRAFAEIGISPRHGYRMIKSGVLPPLYNITDSTAANAARAFRRDELEAAKRRLAGLPPAESA